MNLAMLNPLGEPLQKIKITLARLFNITMMNEINS